MPDRILFIRLSSLGDIVLTAPVIAAARARYPEARIDFCTKAEYVGIVKLLPGLDNIIEVQKEVMNEARNEIASNEYDAIIDLHNNIRSRELTRGLKKLSRVNKRTMRRWLMVKTKRNWMRGQPDVIGRYFEAASRLLEIKDDGQAPHLPALTINEKRVAICPGSKHWNKKWPIEYYIAVAQYLQSRGYQIELFGSSEDRDVCAEIRQAVPNAIDHAGEFSLEELPAAIAQFEFAITNDSGLMHLASAVRVPTLSFFGPTVRAFGFAPRSSQATILENKGLYCRPCTRIGLDRCPEKHFRCMREITPDKAIVQIETLLRDRSSA
ncbi:MAG TPA: glycosyltransferase family 9 protein [Candidatus Kapabacteria bacterium]|nr:glycosyltransferase family 9 protein [Candidatus Kapabacteria bacterium]